VAGLGWYPCRTPNHTKTPTHIGTRTHDQCGDTIEKSQAPMIDVLMSESCWA